MNVFRGYQETTARREMSYEGHRDACNFFYISPFIQHLEKAACTVVNLTTYSEALISDLIPMIWLRNLLHKHQDFKKAIK